jgi:serine/threonine-protein kinase
LDKDKNPTVLGALGRRTGALPKVLLHGSDSAAGGSPYVDSKSVARGIRPKDRGNYQILGEIARGGMGTVLKGHDTDLGRDVALKVLNEGLTNKAVALDRFVEEAQIGGQLQHPGIVPVYELGLMTDDRPYFTMKLVKGRTLSALLEQRATLAEDRRRFLTIFESVCQTVAYAHSKGVIHRDLKPANVMVGAFGEVQVVDWGLAKVLGRGGVADEQRAAESDADQTVIETVRSGTSEHGSDSIVGSVMGTPAYMSPEQAKGDLAKVDERSDVFALGAILCEFLTGAPPYRAVESAGDDADDVDGAENPEDIGSILTKAAKADLTDAYGRLDESGADEELLAICRECLMPSRRQRPAHAEEVARRVQEYFASTEQRARDAELRAAAARVRTRLLALLFLVILIAVGTGSWGVLKVQGERNQRWADARTAFARAADDVRELQAQGRHGDALDAAQAARQLVETVAADEELQRQARRLFLDARQAASAATQADLVRERDAAFAKELSEIRTRKAASSRDYHRVFRKHGLNMVASDLTPVLSLMLASEIEEEYALALDDWARRVAKETAPREGPHFSENLIRLAIELDPHSEHRAMREAIVARDVSALVAKVREGDDSGQLTDLGPGALWVFAHALIDLGAEDDARRLLTIALDAYPDDYLLHDLAAQTAADAGLPELALRHGAAVASLRPASAQAHWQTADRLQSIGEHAAASRAYARAIELGTNEKDAQVKLARSLYFIGDLDGSLAASAKGPKPESDTQRVLVLCRRGDLDLDGLGKLLDRFEGKADRLNLALSFVTHGEAENVDIERGLRVAQDVLVEPRLNEHEIFMAQLALAIGCARLERWSQALVALGGADLMREEGNRYHVALIEAHRAMALVATGHPVRARAALAEAEREFDFLTYSYPEDWRPGSGLRAFMRRARKMVGG